LLKILKKINLVGTMVNIKSPYPYFGSKLKVIKHVWDRFGNDIENYVEPFAGSLAVLLGCPYIPKIETVNDKDYFIPNFWRAVQSEPDKVALHADYPVIEADLHARHRWLISKDAEDFRNKIELDPNYYDVKIAGWWVWGMNASIGMTFTKQRGLKCKPFLSMIGQNITLPTMNVLDTFKALQTRMKKVRVCNNDWEKIVTPSVTYKNKSITQKGITAVFLDPPYILENREDKLYRVETNVFADVCNWAIDNSSNAKMRIAVCGYEGDFEFPSTWESFNWKTTGGFSSFSKDEQRGKDNSKKETIWFNPNCLLV